MASFVLVCGREVMTTLEKILHNINDEANFSVGAFFELRKGRDTSPVHALNKDHSVSILCDEIGDEVRDMKYKRGNRV